LDKTFLDSLGYEVLSDPEAFAKVDDNTFVFAPHLEVAHITAALENSTPAVYIGNDINEYVDSP